MIDIEFDIYNIVRSTVDELMGEGKVEVSSVYTKDPAHFPFVSVVETDNYSDDRTRTTDCNENFVMVTYEVNIYSNKNATKKSECKKIAKAIDDKLMQMNFSRLVLTQIPNLLDSTVYRMTGRYRVMVDKNRRLYNRR